MINKDYYIGLDIGTDSIGWAVTDTNYDLLKANGKSMWGVHLFESGKTAAERRQFRTNRRRVDRATQRIDLLNELFAPEIAKVDPNFLVRLSESKFFPEDKKVESKYSIFDDETYNDVQYHNDFPTIYHLRSELIHSNKEYDIRLVYLAIAHIIKKRGHFLFEGQEIGNATSFEVVYSELLQTLNDYGIDFSLEDASLLENILKDKTISVNDKKKQIKSLFSTSFDEDSTIDQTYAVCELMAGGTVELAKLFDDETLKDAEVTKISFKSGYDDKLPQLESTLSEDLYLLEKIKAVFDWATLTEILNGAEYLSDAKITSYEKHKKDLALLKKLVRDYAPNSYKKIFSENKNANCPNYIAYTGHVSGKGKYAEKYSCSQEDFCKFVLKELPKDLQLEDENEKYIFAELQNFTALPKQVTKDNSVIPYQLNKVELEKILENASNYFDFLNEESDGKTTKEKIVMLLTFRIPYYVGPLNGNSEKAWIVRKEGKIYPWNFEEKVDTIASATKFIEKMTNQCTYLVGESVLPKESILYSKFNILNQLNNIKVDGQKLSVSVKNTMFDDCFINVEKQKKITIKAIKTYLSIKGVCDKDSEITGIDAAIEGTMKSYIDFKRILGESFDEQVAEEIIYKITVLGKSKKLIDWYLRNDVDFSFSEEQINEIEKLNYSGWGRLSKKFLKEIYHTDAATGECISVISALKNTDDNLMQLLSNNYSFVDAIDEFNKEKNDIEGSIKYSNIEKLYVSPAVKRSIWRTSLIVKEIVNIAGHNPKKIFIEMARDSSDANKGKRTISRREQLLACYKESKKDCDELAKELSNYDDNQLRSDKLFLYYAQLGRCLYSGDPIDLDNLLSNNSNYDIEHIYPQSKTKDDSLDNRILVRKKLNEDKGDVYPIPTSYRNERTVTLWKKLLSIGLISKEKYNRLMRTEGFSDNELAGFISRQIVETRQSTKAVADLLNKAYDDTKIVYVKAGNVSDFRHHFDIVKCRAVNDHHHAKDAYLNIVVGNVYDTKFGLNVVKFISDGNIYSLNRMYDYDVKRGNNVAWLKDSSIATVKKNVFKNNVLFTRYSSEQKGGFFDQQIVAHGNGQMPIKTSDERLANIEKYGGYNKVAGAYFVLVRHIKKGKTVKTIESVPIYIASKIRNNPLELGRYLTAELKLVEPTVLISKINYNTLFEVDGFRMHLSGKSGNQFTMKCAEQLILSENCYKYCKKIEKFIERRKSNKDLMISHLSGISSEGNENLYLELLNKLESTKYNIKLSSQVATLKNGFDSFKLLSLENQCELLFNALLLFKSTPGGTDLRSIGGSKQAGVLCISSDISLKNNMLIVNQSITGIFENKIDVSSL